MASKRMFSQTVVRSGRFLKMSATVRELYFQLGMDADDEGIVEAWNTMKLCNASAGDLEDLVRKGFIEILNSEDLIAYIVDWEINNKIRKDRWHESRYHNLLMDYRNSINGDSLITDAISAQMQLPQGVQPNDNQMATKCLTDGNQMATKCLTDDNQMSAEDRLVKDRLGKVRLVEDRIDMSQERNNISIHPSTIKINLEEAMEKWNSLVKYGVSQLRILGPGTDRAKKLNACIERFGLDSFDAVIDQIKQSDYLQGKTEFSNGIDFAWAVELENYANILEGKYKNIKNNKSKVRNFCPEEPERTSEDFEELEQQLLDN